MLNVARVDICITSCVEESLKLRFILNYYLHTLVQSRVCYKQFYNLLSHFSLIHSYFCITHNLKRYINNTKTSLVSWIVGYFPQEVLSPLNFHQVQIDKL